MRDRDRGRQEVEHGDAAQQSLQDDGGQRGHAEPADPALRRQAPRGVHGIWDLPGTYWTIGRIANVDHIYNMCNDN
mgnify:CR=1 FL=1